MTKKSSKSLDLRRWNKKMFDILALKNDHSIDKVAGD